MRAGRVIALLLLLNAAVLWYFAQNRRVSERSAGTQKFQEAASIPPPSDSRMTSTSLVTTVVATNQFRWSELEASDYREYIKRLRAIGCPEQTLRDLIIADLDKLYAAKLQAIYPLPKEAKFWESEEADLANNHDQRTWQRQQREIEREKAAILKELLGADLALERQRNKGQVDKIERRLSFLPEERRSELRGLLDRWDDREQSIRGEAWDTGSTLGAEDRAQLKALREEREAALSQLLTPEEREHYDLWMSPTAEALRHDFYGLGTTEEEFRAIYQMRKEIDEAWPPDSIDTSDETAMRAWGGALLQLEDNLKSTLGEDRFAMYQRGQDQKFHELNTTISRFKLPREKAAEAYEYLRVAQQEKNRLADSGSFTPEQQVEILRRIDGETERALREVLGEGPYHYFSRRVR